MLDNKTKARIAQEAKSYAGTTLPNVPIGVPKTFVDEGKRKHYIAGAEAEATRAQELIEAYRKLCEIQNDTLNEMEKHAKKFEPNREKVARAYELLKKIEGLTKYNTMNKETPEQEAERLYPYKDKERIMEWHDAQIIDLKREVFCETARQYMDTIEKLRAENERLSESLDDTQKFLAAAERGAGFQQKQITELLEERDALVVIMDQIAAIASSKTKEA